MESAQHSLISALKAIRDQADSVLKKIEHGTKQRSPSWKCAGCGHVKHFTRPATVDVAAPCPRCGGETFDPV